MTDQPAFGPDIEQNRRALDQIVEQARQRAERFATVRDRIAGTSVTERSADGGIEVTVASSGALTGLRVADRVANGRGSEIAGQILTCVQRAQAKIAGKVQEIVSETVPADDPTAAHVVDTFRSRFPEPPEPELPNNELSIGAPADDETGPEHPPAPPRRAPRPGRPSGHDDNDDDDDGWSGRSFLR